MKKLDFTLPALRALVVILLSLTSLSLSAESQDFHRLLYSDGFALTPAYAGTWVYALKDADAWLNAEDSRAESLPPGEGLSVAPKEKATTRDESFWRSWGLPGGSSLPSVINVPDRGKLLETGDAVVTCGVINAADPVVALFEVRTPVTTNNSYDLVGGNYPIWNRPAELHPPSWSFTNLGNVFGVAVDRERAMYVTASSSFSPQLNFLSQANGTSMTINFQSGTGAVGRAAAGGPNATAELNAAGTIYKLDPVTGVPTVFAVLPQQATTANYVAFITTLFLSEGTRTNTGPGLGNIAYDQENDQFFATNFEDGKIYRITADGTVQPGAFDYGTPDNGAAGMLALQDRVWGVGVYNGRVYYSVWTDKSCQNNGDCGSVAAQFYDNGPNPTVKPFIRSVAIDPATGDFIPGTDQLEYDGADLEHTAPISDIAFDADGNMLIAQKTMLTDYAGYNHRSQVAYLTGGNGTWVADPFLTGPRETPTNANRYGTEAYGGVDFGYDGNDVDATVWFSSADMVRDANIANGSQGPHGVAGFRLSDLAGTDFPDPRAIIPYDGTVTSPSSIDLKGSGGDIEIVGDYVSPGNLVWGDTNDNGLLDGAEAGIPNVPVNLLNAAGTVVLAMTTTNAAGQYLFTDLLPGDYIVEIVPPDGFVTSTGSLLLAGTGPFEPAPDADMLVAIDSDDNGTAVGATIRSEVVTLEETNEPTGEAGLTGLTDFVADNNANYTVDFGLIPPPPCDEPTVLAFAIQASCNSNGTINTDGYLQLSEVTGGLSYAVDDGMGFGPSTDLTGANYPLQIVTGLANPSSDRNFTIRVYDDAAGSSACFTDVVVTLRVQDCAVGCDCEEYVYLNEVNGTVGQVHKFLINPDATFTEVLNDGLPWYSGPELLRPHGLGIDLNGYLYIGENNGNGDIRRLTCDGTLIPEGGGDGEFNYRTRGQFNISSIGNTIYYNDRPASGIFSFDACETGEAGPEAIFCEDLDGGTDWGFYIDPRTELMYATSTFNGANNNNFLWVFSEADFDDDPSTCIDAVTLGTPLPRGNIRGVVTDETGNIYIAVQDNRSISIGSSMLLKYGPGPAYPLLGQSVVDDSDDGNPPAGSASGNGFNRIIGLVYSEGTGLIYASTEALNDDCIAVFNTDLDYLGQTVPAPGNGANGKGIAITKECCPTNNNQLIEINACNSSNVEPVFLNEIFPCEGVICEAQWTPSDAASAAVYDPCSQTVMAGTTAGCYTFTRSSDGTGNSNQCGAFVQTLSLSIGEVTAAVVAGDQEICAGQDPVAFTVVTPASGSSDPIYQWSVSIESDSTGFTDIPGANSAIYDPTPADLTADTVYFRQVTSIAGCTSEMCADTSNSLIVITRTNCLDLALIKTLDLGTNPGPFVPGSTVDFFITVYNQGAIEATDIEVKDYVPTGLSLAPASAPDWTISADTAILTTPFSLGVGMDSVLSISFVIDEGFMLDTLTNRAEISNFDDDGDPATEPLVDEDSTPNDNGGTPAEVGTPDELDDDGDGTPGTEDDPNDEDDYDFEGIAILQSFDLALVKRIDLNATPGPFTYGSEVTFVIEVKNQGTLDATGVEVADYIPEGLSLVAGPTWTTDVDTARLAMPFDLAAGGTETLSITFTIDLDFAGDMIDNVAEISAAMNALGLPDEDSRPGDNGGDAPEVDTDDEENDDGANGNGIADNPADSDDFDLARVSIETVSLGSTVFLDNNNDGLQNGADMGIAMVEVQLWDAATMMQVFTDATGARVLTAGEAAPTLTDADGNYHFTNLIPGDYYVVVPTAPAAAPLSSNNTGIAFVETDPDDNLDNDDEGVQTGGSGTSVSSDTITLSLGGEPENGTVDGTETAQGNLQDDAFDSNGNMTVDFGFFAPVAVGDTAFVDLDGDGFQTPGEPGIGGVTVTLLDSNGDTVMIDADGMAITGVVMTAADGSYLFDNLPPGEYSVIFDISTADNAEFYDFTLANTADDATDSDNSIALSDSTAQSDPTAFLNSGEQDLTLDVGVVCAVSVELADPFTVCSTQPIDLTQDVVITPDTSATFGATWTTTAGTGDFLDASGGVLTAPFRFGEAVSYRPSSGDAMAGAVIFILTTDDPAGPCDPVSAQVTVTVLKVDCGALMWDGTED